MKTKLLIRDLSLRDGQQSLFATRMNQAQIETVIYDYKKANFYAMEVWGGAVPDSIMRFLNENPWTRLERYKEVLSGSTKLTALSRGRNLFGYNPYPKETITAFNSSSVKSGIDIMRIFDCLNDVDNMKSTIEAIKEANGTADCAICYTVDPKFSKSQKLKARLKGEKLPKKIFTIDYFVDKARQMAEFGADMITIKDMAGLVTPSDAGKLVKRLKKELGLPIDFHTHCTPGYGLASMLMAIVNGVDVVDTNLMAFAGGSAAPAFELIQIFADKLDLDTGVDLKTVNIINKKLIEIRKELSDFDSYKQFPIEFDISNYSLPKEIDNLFDLAIKYAKEDNEELLLSTCHKIDKYFNFVSPNEAVKAAEIPGGMYTNMLAQLKQLGVSHLLDEVLKTVPIVRLKAGCPPLVTPTSQIVGAQTVNCVIDKLNGKPFYTNVSTQFHNLVKGQYGKTPIKINPDFREKICKVREEIPYDTDKYVKVENPTLPEYNNELLAKNDHDYLLLELFPAVAGKFLKDPIRKKYELLEEEKEQRKIEASKKAMERYKNMENTEMVEHLLSAING